MCGRGSWALNSFAETRGGVCGTDGHAAVRFGLVRVINIASATVCIALFLSASFVGVEIGVKLRIMHIDPGL